MCEIPSPCFNAVFTGFLLDHGSLPPDFTSACVKSLALVLPRKAAKPVLGFSVVFTAL